MKKRTRNSPDQISSPAKMMIKTYLAFSVDARTHIRRRKEDTSSESF